MNLTSCSGGHSVVRVATSSQRAPVQERAHKTRAALLEAAEREFSERGYAQTTAKSITARAGVATGSFYQYFADKDAALYELARGRAKDLADRVEAVPFPAGVGGAANLEREARQGVRRMVAEVVEYHRRDRGLHAVLTERRLADPELEAIASATERAFLEHIEQRLACWHFLGDRKAMAFIVFGLIEGTIHSHVLGTRTLSDRRFLDALTDAIVTLVRSGIGA
jgi:AcrR family transcriptional regulator